jgi:hypothetical protein
VKKILLLLSSLFISANILLAQDDELPPPSSRPRSDSAQRAEQNLPKADDFSGFKPKKKVDLSKFIIEPNFNLSISQGRIDAGLSPYVGYNVWKGLCVGGGITYFYTGFSGIVITDVTGQTLGSAKANFHTYGGGVFLQYNIWKGFFARTRFELLHRDMADLNSQPIPKNPNNYSDGFYFSRIQKNIPALLLGVGYNLLRSKNFFMPVMVSYDVLHSVVDKQYSLYPRGLVVQLGFVTLF